MDLRNLNRVMMFTRTLKRYNKAEPEKLTATGVYILCSIYQLCKVKGGTLQDIEVILSKNNRTRSRNDILSTLKYFEHEGLVTKTTAIPNRYRITITGKNALNTLEQKLRAGRMDR